MGAWCLVLFFASAPSMELPEPAAKLLAGGLASAIAKTSLAPFERIKLILQTSSAHAGPLDAITTVVRQQGLPSLWQGNVANLARIVPTYALRFALHDTFRGLVGDTSAGRLSLGAELLAGALSGATVCFATHPLDLMRTTLAVRGPIGRNGGILGTWRHLVQTHGVLGPYRGLFISLLEIAPYTAITLGGYEHLKHMGLFGGESPRAKLCASWAAGLCASLACYPLDSVKRRMMVDAVLAGASSKYQNSVLRCLKRISMEEGLHVLYRGCALNALKSAPAFAITAVLNDVFKGMLLQGQVAGT